MYLPDWEHRFHTYLQGLRQSDVAFNWNSTVPDTLNCCSFVGRGIEAVSGVDLYSLVCGDIVIKSVRDAARVIRQHGVSTLEELFPLFMESRELAFMRLGDIGFIPSEDPESQALGMAYTAGLVAPPYVYYMDPLEGLARLDKNMVVMAFNTGSAKG